MNDWNEGYFTNTPYTFGCYRELSPMFQKFVLLMNGIRSPEISQDSIHCELGFGQGVSIAIHAATNPGVFIGTDFNPAHASQANDLLQSFSDDPRTKFFDDSFEELYNRDLPQFDSISLHGIWSWVSEENRQMILKFARKFLKPGGIFYVSYNVFPGQTAMSQFRELMMLHDKFEESSSSTTKRVQNAVDFVKRFIDAKPMMLEMIPNFVSVFEEKSRAELDYIAHEFFNEHWQSMYFSEIAGQMSTAKLDFACSAELIELYDRFNYSEQALEYLKTIDNPILKRQMKDYFLNRRFREDFFMRGVRRLTNVEISEQLSNMKFVFISEPKNVTHKFVVYTGVIDLGADSVIKMANYLASENFRPKSLFEISQQIPNLDTSSLLQIITLMVHNRFIAPCQPDDVIRAVKKKSTALNRYIARRAGIDGNVRFLASPVTGLGIPAGLMELMFIDSMYRGRKHSLDLARDVWQIMFRKGERVIIEGRRLESEEENIAEIEKSAQKFLNDRLPIFRALQII